MTSQFDDADTTTPRLTGASPRTTGPGRGRAAKRPGSIALSPSRAKDFHQCPLLFRLRTVDRLPEPGSLATHKGTLVHAVLEQLYDLPVPQRTAATALDLLPARWQAHQQAHPEVMGLFGPDQSVHAWLDEAAELVRHYFTMENPRRLEPAEREMFVHARTRTGLALRGFVDRLDVAPNGDMRVVDYKTGRSPAARFQEQALFQMRFYALVLWRMRGQMPRRLQLLYLRDGRTLTHDPHPAELEATEMELDRLWDEVENCARHDQFLPRQSRLCDWCAFQGQCPIFGGVTPPLPQDATTRILAAREPGAQD